MTDTTTDIPVHDQGELRHALESALAFRLARGDRDLLPVFDTVRIVAPEGARSVMVWGTDRYRMIRVEVALTDALASPVDVLIPMDYATKLARELSKSQYPCTLTVNSSSPYTLTLDTYEAQTTVPLFFGDFPRIENVLEGAGKPTGETPAIHQLLPETLAKLAKLKPHPSETRKGGTVPAGTAGRLTIRWGDPGKAAHFLIGETGTIHGAFMPMRGDIPER